MRFLFSLLLILSFLYLGSIVTETASLREFIYGPSSNTSYDNWLSHTSEGVADNSPNTYAPFDRQLNGFGDYYDPNEEEEEIWSEMVNLFLADALEDVDLLIEQNELPFETVIFHDTDTNRDYHILREKLNSEYVDDNDTETPWDDVHGSFDFGWGIYIRDPESTSHVLVNVVHPNDDFIATPIAVKAFQDWNAKFLFINGSGREVAGSSQNSDPSRTSSHPFNAVYKAACDQIRLETSRRELSAQIHSYDWDKHEGYAACQVSSGNGRTHPNLPIRDESDHKRDLINLTDYLVIPQNSIGNNQNVLLDDYYSVYCSPDFTYLHSDEEYDVNTSVDLPGYSSNKQMNYSSPNMLNHYDVQEPFFHMEIDELPNCYPQFEIDYHLFYGIDLVTDIFEQDHIFDKAIAFYTPWLDAFNEALSYLSEFDDGAVPDSPENFHSLNDLTNSITLAWDNVSDYEFEGYEILYAQEPIGDDNYQVISRDSIEALASQDVVSLWVDFSVQQNDYYVKIRAKDFNGNVSELSDELHVGQTPAIVSNFHAEGLDGESSLSWNASWEDALAGFSVYRSQNGSSFYEVASYVNNPTLQPPEDDSPNFQYLDTDLDNDILYTYKLTATKVNGVEYEHSGQTQSWPTKIYSLQISDGQHIETVHFSANHYASNYYDSHDVAKDPYDGEELYVAFTLPYGSINFLETNVVYNFDFFENYKMLDLVINSLNTDIELELSTDYFTEGGEAGLYLRNLATGELQDFQFGDISIVTPGVASGYYDLIWGTLSPNVTVDFPATQIFKGGDEVWLEWSILYEDIVSNIAVNFKSEDNTIELLDGISGMQDGAMISIPSGYDEHDLILEVLVEANNGNIYSYSSYGSYGIISAMQELHFEQGWQSSAYPFLDEGLDVPLIFGDDNLCYSFTYEDGFQSEPIFNNAWGNLLFFSNSASYYDSQSFHNGNYVVPLYHGWNMVPNRYPIELHTETIKIYYDSLSDAITANTITPQFVVYENGEFKQVSYLKPYQSGFIFQNEYDINYYNVTPYGSGVDLPVMEASQATVRFDQGSKASVTIGYAYESLNTFDLKYDLPAYPELPDNTALHAFLVPGESNNDCPYDELFQEYLVAPNDNSPEQLFWEFGLDPISLDPIEISLSVLTLPEDYNVLLMIGGIEAELTESNYVYYPQTLESVQGELSIRHEMYVDAEDVEVVSEGFKNYPNPFNPNTTFSFSLLEEEIVNLEIYNVKGQKIKNLVNEVMPMGKYERSWSGCDEKGNRVASGVYLGRLKIGNKSFNRKLLLLK